MKWINFLHIYQLSNTDGYAISEATERSYQRIISGLEQHPKVKFTLNISGCLIARWQDLGYQELINRIKKLVKRGQIELVGSVSHHCLMPLTPPEEVKFQIINNTKILQDNFGKNIKLQGFFMPEMAYSAKMAKLVKSLGFEWLILDEVSCKDQGLKPDLTKNYIDKASGLKIVFRSKKFSNTYLPQFLSDKKLEMRDRLVITATDGELYGLRYEDPQGDFEKLLSMKDLQTDTISHFIKTRKQKVVLALRNSNWESSPEELAAGKPYFSWFNPDNRIQSLTWEFANFTFKTVQKFRKDDNYDWARFHTRLGFASCTFWWASAKDFSYVYGPYAWNPDEIERGLNEFIRAIRSLHDVTSRSVKVKAEKLYSETKRIIWEKHWNYYWKKKHWHKIDNSR